MTMIDYYLLGARVSFCVCKNSCHVVQKLPCCLSGSSLSSDIATQVTCIVVAQRSSKFSSSDVVTCFLLPGGLVFLFPPTRCLSSPSPFSTRVCQGQVSAKFSSKSLLKFLLRHISSSTRLFHNVSMPNPQPGRKRGCGDEYHRKFPTFKKEKRVRLLARVHCSWFVALVTWQLA